MGFERVYIEGLRSLEPTLISFTDSNNPVPPAENPGQVNIFWGENASGKSTVLEAIHLLIHGKSFRTRSTSDLPMRGAGKGLRLEGIVTYMHEESGISDRTCFRLAFCGPTSKSMKTTFSPPEEWYSLGSKPPLLYLGPDSHNVASGSPSTGRNFLDFGAFHVEQTFADHWMSWRRCLRQRNILLNRCKTDGEWQSRRSEVRVWGERLAQHAVEVTSARKRWLAEFVSELDELLELVSISESSKLNFFKNLVIEYKSRFPDNYTSAMERLEESLEKDFKLGYTTTGPQRDALIIRYQGTEFHSIASRGELRLTDAVLRLLQLRQIAKRSGKESIVLLDDFTSEFDASSQKFLATIMQSFKAQRFITALGSEEARRINQMFSGDNCENISVFHVKHNSLVRISP